MLCIVYIVTVPWDIPGGLTAGALTSHPANKLFRTATHLSNATKWWHSSKVMTDGEVRWWKIVMILVFCEHLFTKAMCQRDPKQNRQLPKSKDTKQNRPLGCFCRTVEFERQFKTLLIVLIVCSISLASRMGGGTCKMAQNIWTRKEFCGHAFPVREQIMRLGNS